MDFSRPVPMVGSRSFTLPTYQPPPSVDPRATAPPPRGSNDSGSTATIVGDQPPPIGSPKSQLVVTGPDELATGNPLARSNRWPRAAFSQPQIKGFRLATRNLQDTDSKIRNAVSVGIQEGVTNAFNASTATLSARAAGGGTAGAGEGDTAGAGFDVSSLISSPFMLIGLGLIVFFYIRKKG